VGAEKLLPVWAERLLPAWAEKLLPVWAKKLLPVWAEKLLPSWAKALTVRADLPVWSQKRWFLGCPPKVLPVWAKMFCRVGQEGLRRTVIRARFRERERYHVRLMYTDLIISFLFLLCNSTICTRTIQREGNEKVFHTRNRDTKSRTYSFSTIVISLITDAANHR